MLQARQPSLSHPLLPSSARLQLPSHLLPPLSARLQLPSHLLRQSFCRPLSRWL
jgi:hypothetical protein